MAHVTRGLERKKGKGKATTWGLYGRGRKWGEGPIHVACLHAKKLLLHPQYALVDLV